MTLSPLTSWLRGVQGQGRWKGKVVVVIVKLYKIGNVEMPFKSARENLQREAGVLRRASTPRCAMGCSRCPSQRRQPPG